MTTQFEIAGQIVGIIPAIFRTLAPEIKCVGGTVTHSHFRILHMLAIHPYNLSELAERQAVTLATMSNSVDILEQRGWICRNPEINDRRKIRVELTEEGNQILEECHQQLLTRLQQKLNDLDDFELSQLEQGLKILARVLDASPKEVAS